jgi:hypothetical protein
MRRTTASLLCLTLVALVTAPLVGADKPEAEKAAANAAGLVPAPPEPDGMVKLFNGKDLSGWEGHPDL